MTLAVARGFFVGRPAPQTPLTCPEAARMMSRDWRPLSQAVRQWIANPPSPVRIREGPLNRNPYRTRRKGGLIAALVNATFALRTAFHRISQERPRSQPAVAWPALA